MKLKNHIKSYAMIIFTVTMLFGGISVLHTSQANNGRPNQVLSGEFGNRIWLIPCLFDTLDGIECADIDVSASESNYVQHGWNAVTGRELGQGQPAKFQLFLDGEEIRLQRFSFHFVTEFGENGVVWIFYTIFEPGSLSVGTHSIEGLWTSGDPNFTDFHAPTNLVVSA